MQEINTVVVGGGIAGLSSAFWLNKSGVEVCVLEKNAFVGGCIQTEHKNGYLIEQGPGSALETSEPIKKLVSDLNLKEEQVYASNSSKNKFVVRHASIQTLPSTVWGFITTPLFSTRGKLRFLLEPFITKSEKTKNGIDESLADFTRRRVGQNFLDFAINPMVAGIFAGDPEKLSVRTAFPKLFNLEYKYGGLVKGAIAGFWERRKSKTVGKNRAKQFSFKKGMSTIVKTLEEELKDKIYLSSELVDIQKDGEAFVLGYKKDGQEELHQIKTNNIVMCAPTYAQAVIFKDFLPSLSEEMLKIFYPSTATVTTAYKNKNVSEVPDGYGYLIPLKEYRKTLGTTWLSTVYDNRAPEGYSLYMTMVGGVRDPQNFDLSDDEMLAAVVYDLQELSGVKGEPEYHSITRWKKAIPQYHVGYHKFQEALSQAEKDNPGLYFAGNYRSGIGTGDSVKTAYEAVEKLVNLL